MKKDQNRKNIVALPFLLLLTLMLALNACDPPGGGTGPVYETWTPPPSATPTCAPNMLPSTPEGLRTRLFVVLYDPRITGDEYLELENGEETQDIPYFISSIVPELIKPSDQASVFYMGYSSYDDAKVVRLHSYTTPPPLYNTPAPWLTLTPLPSPISTPPPGFEAVKATNVAKTALAARSGTEVADHRRYDCEVDYFNETVNTTATAWNNAAATEISSINNELNMALKDADKKGKPFSTDELYYGGVYYGLSFATTVFQSDCKNYDSCILLIIDDMHIAGENNPDNLSINLDGVKTYVIMPNCSDIDEPNCKYYEEYWDS